jgi:replicative DNA helicase
MTTATASAQKELWIHDGTVRSGLVEIDGYKLSIAQLPLTGDENAERSIIVNLLLAGLGGQANEIFEQVYPLKVQDFFKWRYGAIYHAVTRLHSTGRDIDYVSIISQLQTKNPKTGKTALEEIGGSQFIIQLMGETVGKNLKEYARIIRESATKRTMLVQFEHLRVKLHNIKPSDMINAVGMVSEFTGDIQQRVVGLNPDNGFKVGSEMPEHLKRVWYEQHHPEAVEYTTTGFKTLDAYINGWGKRRLYLVGGSNGMGKSAFLLSTAIAAMRAGKRVCFVSLELSKQELLERIACNVGAIDSRRMSRREMTAEELGRFDPIMRELKQLDSQGATMRLVCLPFKPTLDQFCIEIEKVWQTGGFDMLIIDYVGWGRFNESDARLRTGNTVGFTGAMFNRIDTFKTKYNCPVVVAVQINRDHENSKDKRPELRHIADSKIGGDNADVVMFVHRPDRYDDSAMPNCSELIIRKNRYGEEGTAQIRAELRYNRFEEWLDPSADLKFEDL